MKFDEIIQRVFMVICLLGGYGLLQTFYFLINVTLKPTWVQSFQAFGIMFVVGALVWLIAKRKK